MWLNWHDLESPSVYHPVKFHITSPSSDSVNGGPMSQVKVFYKLLCGHVSPGVINLSVAKLPCIWHNGEVSEVIGVITHEWRAKCDSCSFARWAGISQHNARVYANAHYRRNGAHSVGIEYVINPSAVKAKERLASVRA